MNQGPSRPTLLSNEALLVEDSAQPPHREHKPAASPRGFATPFFSLTSSSLPVTLSPPEVGLRSLHQLVLGHLTLAFELSIRTTSTPTIR
jgi:hypothetical protein